MCSALKGVFSNYSTISNSIVEKTREREEALRLADGTSYSRFFIHPTPTDKVILFFHGFTAVPQQFVPIGEAFFQAGYNVLIPRLPGHGVAGNWEQKNPPPLPENRVTYQEFGLEWLDKARFFGEKVVVGGLSGGSTLAAWLALERPEKIDRGLIFAPYLSNTNKLVDLVVRLFNIYFKWKTPPGAVNYGYEGFYMPALRLFLDMGDEVLQRAKTSPAAPMLIVSSECDRAVGRREPQKLFKAVVKFQPKCQYIGFEKALNIPHNMMTKEEGNQRQDLVISLALDYVGNW
ncbi:alpha/beta hydrolase [Microseira sp. BLCC-F43]|jgi:alpha-beta hydrolase superfamily lysophospholipase|uniref:alpha/beta hydrolase n=1 Tax=Microseira sp. BLCC-F43 TaxID=3153602 RepID=UPI0035B77E86